MPDLSFLLAPQLLVLLPLAFVGGLINAVIGGGGLILVPGLFATFPKALPAALLGTDKLASVMGHAFAMRQYARRIQLPWRMLLLAAAAAFVGSYLGARVVYLLPVSWVRPLVIGLLIVMLIYTWFKPDFGAVDAKRTATRRDLWVGAILGSAIGFYDGFFGPGTGSFLVFLFVRVFHFDFLRATASAKVVNTATNLAALCFFVPAGLVFYQFAIPMAAASIGGAYVGTHLAFMGGNAWIRRLFLLLASMLLAKMVWDTLQLL